MLAGLLLLVAGCRPDALPPPQAAGPPTDTALVNLTHLDHLGQTVARGDTTLRLIHIYAEAPDYAWVGDDDEGIACVDDAARAAVVYLHHYAATGDEDARAKAQELLRFVQYMQRPDGLFDNFVWDADLRINIDHANSRSPGVTWWTARAVWALGEGARALQEADPDAARTYIASARRVLPHLDALLSRYGETTTINGRLYPRWLPYEFAADATSELLLGLTALQEVAPDPALRQTIDRFAEGTALMQHGTVAEPPYGAHLSWREMWHGWGNAQTSALVAAGRLPSAVHEADHFYPRLLVDGWGYSYDLETNEMRRFEQIAYAVRPVVTGLLALADATGETRYARLAGLAASWFTGANVADVAMYDPTTGRGYDGITDSTTVNYNAGAESTIEALLTMQAVARRPEAHAWLHARRGEPIEAIVEGVPHRYRLFSVSEADSTRRLAVVLNLTDATAALLDGDALDAFLASAR